MVHASRSCQLSVQYCRLPLGRQIPDVAGLTFTEREENPMMNTETVRGMKVLAAGLLVLVSGLMVSGCGRGDGGREESGETRTVARAIRDGAEPMNEYQKHCPVCGNPISAEVHTESTEERVYFDSEQCMQKWSENPDQYMGNLKKQGEKAREIQKKEQQLQEKQGSGEQ